MSAIAIFLLACAISRLPGRNFSFGRRDPRLPRRNFSLGRRDPRLPCSNFSFCRRDPSITAPYLLAGAILDFRAAIFQEAGVMPCRDFSKGRRDAAPQFIKRPA
jgi:hypothetical protein